MSNGCASTVTRVEMAISGMRRGKRMDIVGLLILWVVGGFVVAGLFGSLARMGRHPAEPEPVDPATPKTPTESAPAPFYPSQPSTDSPGATPNAVHVLPFDRTERRR